MTPWKLAAVQMDCRLADVVANRDTVCRHLHTAADAGANLIVFPECILTGYGFTSREETQRCSEEMPGASTETIAAVCVARRVWCIYGTIERAGTKLYNAAALIGPKGFVAKYRKCHLPCLGADRFTDPGEGPLVIHDLGGLKVGIGICFDGGFPEFPRVLTLLGADLIVLPTNWADKAIKTATYVPPSRALENAVYFAAVNRVGTESGFHYIGQSSIYAPSGDCLARADDDREAILYAEIDPEAARRKRVVHCVGEYEVDRVNWRRPDLYGPLLHGTPFSGHNNRPGG
jgi:predicted amidohydrolase